MKKVYELMQSMGDKFFMREEFLDVLKKLEVPDDVRKVSVISYEEAPGSYSLSSRRKWVLDIDGEILKIEQAHIYMSACSYNPADNTYYFYFKGKEVRRYDPAF